MQDLTQLIIQNSASGKIDKKIAAEILKRLLERKDKENIQSNEIAVVGIAVRLPMAHNVDEFWNNLVCGKDCISEFPEVRKKDTESLVLENIGLSREEIRYKEGGYLDRIDGFDYKFFNLSPKEASLMDPNQRLFLETVWEALEDAGYGGTTLAGSKTGVFVGHSSWPVYEGWIIKKEPSSVSMSIPGNMSAIIAGRIAHELNFKGPSMLVDTACSSALIAVHLACQSIQNGECDQAIAGGVRVNFLPVEDVYEVGMESASGRVRSFAEGADGSVWGEGVAAIFLKPLVKAIEDRDAIYAVIKGSAINQNGTTVGITVPNALAQEEAIVSSWKKAGIDPETVSYVEAFGSGTNLGDPIEMTGLHKAFRKFTEKKQFCALGSVKTNIGHLDSVAGLAGLIKAALALKHKVIPATIHFNRPNGKISFEETAFYISDRTREWETDGAPRRCGVNAYSFSGANCHVVLEEAPEVAPEPTRERPCVLFISAKTKTALINLVEAYQRYLVKTDEELADICYTASVGRVHYDYRLAFIAQSKEELLEKLRGLDEERLEGLMRPGVYYGEQNTLGKSDLVHELDREAVEEAVSNCAADGDHRSWEILAQLYMGGAEINWTKLYTGTFRRRVHLPVYPFERKRCWLEGDVSLNQISLLKIDDLMEQGQLPGKLLKEFGESWGKLKQYLTTRKAEEKPETVFLTGNDTGEYTLEQQLIAEVWGSVLGLQTLDLADNFFGLGGNSIIAMKVANELSRKTGIAMDPAVVMQYPVLLEFAQMLEKMSSVSKSEAYKTIPRVEQEKYYPVSSAQKRLIALGRFEGADMSYNMPAALLVEGELSQERMELALKTVIERHEILRTSFPLVSGEPVQKIHETVAFSIETMQIDETQITEAIRGFIRPFDLQEAPLLRVGLSQIKKDRHLLLVDMHHIISDGTSLGILVKEFVALYQGESLPPLEIQFKDYTSWQNSRKNSEEYVRQEKFWLEVFREDVPVLNMFTDYPRPVVQSFAGSTITMELERELTQKIRELAGQTNTTPFMILFAAYYVLLFNYTGQNDIVVGCGIAGRNHPDLQGLIGMFVNTLAMRNRPVSNCSFREFLADVKANALAAYAHQDYPLEALVEKVATRRDLSRNPIFDTVFVLQNTGDATIEIEGLRFLPHRFEIPTSKFDLTVNLREQGEALEIDLEYCTSLFRAETIRRLGTHYQEILQQIVVDIDIKLSQIQLASVAERQLILGDFNATQSDCPKEKTIPELFEEAADCYSNKVALVEGDMFLTYAQLNQAANRLARVLRAKGVGPDVPVGLITERSSAMMVGILGILKAGGAYVPIDAKYPTERIGFMLQDSGVHLVLAQDKEEEKLLAAGFKGEILSLGGDYANQDGANLPIINKPKDLAYIMYTSGSTGSPKGVMVEHGNVVRLVINTNYIKFYENDRILLTGAVVFDATTFEFWGALLNGLRLDIVDEDTFLMAGALHTALQEKKITILWLTTSLFTLLSKENPKIFADLRVLLVGGEVLPPKNAQIVLENCPGLNLLNLYGPTENTTFSTYYPVKLPVAASVPIGKPIANSTAVILDQDGNLQPIGVPGELCVGGVGVARGYLNHPDLTEQKFKDDPFMPGGRLYYTGDSARWLPDGNIEFMGRIDNQVKIRGFRIELSEIEQHLLNHPQVQEAAVKIGGSPTNKFLCAFFVATQEISTLELRSYFAETLPEHMIPSFFIQLDKMPLNTSGKIDRQALQLPDDFQEDSTSYVAPGNELEGKMVAIWQEVLERKRIGVQDDFFELGGHSLKAAAIIERINKTCLSQLKLVDLFKRHTIRELAQYIRENQRDSEPENNRVAQNKHVVKAQGQWLKIPLLHDDARNCNQDILASVATWWGRGYEMMFISSWRFDLIPSDALNEPATLGERIVIIETDVLKDLEEYHGIKVTPLKIQGVKNILNKVAEELTAGRPVGLAVDAYVCPWDPGYRRHHFSHAILVIGWDEAKRCLICMDPYYAVENGALPIDELQEAEMLSCVTFVLGEESKEGQTVELREIVTNATAILEETNSFNNMRRFAKEIRDLDLGKELEGYESDSLQAPLVWRLYEVSRTRRRFAKALSFLAGKLNLPELADIASQLDKAGIRWISVQGMMVKASFQEDPTETLNIISDKLYRMAAEEELLARALHNLLQSGGIRKDFPIQETAELFIPDAKNVIFLDLKHYFNNNGFGGNEPECAAEMSNGWDGGGFFLQQGLSRDNIWVIGRMTFKLEYLWENENDNISCAGQVISVPKRQYSGFMYLGCSEYGSHSEPMLVKYTNGQTEEVALELSDWSLVRPVFRETVAWAGKAAISTKHEGIQELPFPVFLFAKHGVFCKSGTIESIQLPKCPNIHVFAISLY